MSETLRDFCEQGFTTVLRGFNTKCVPSGNPGAGLPFVSYANGREKHEGDLFPLAMSRAEAERVFRDGWPAFRERWPGNTLLWRMEPEFMHMDDDTWAVYCRLLIVEA